MYIYIYIYVNPCRFSQSSASSAEESVAMKHYMQSCAKCEKGLGLKLRFDSSHRNKETQP